MAKNVFLTGASSGIGRAAAVALTEAGYNVWGTSREISRLPVLPRLRPVQLDLASPESIRQGFAGALEQAAHFDVLINNAGSGHFGPAENLSHDAIAAQFQVLLFGQLQLMQLALPGMKARRRGMIINVSSLAARLPVPFMAAYNSAKAALASFVVSIQLELPNCGVHVVDLQPGDIDTGFNDIILKGEAGEYSEQLSRAWATVDYNMKHAPGPELVARRILRLLEQTNPPPRVTVGAAFQAVVAPLIFRFLPQRVRIWGLKRYYKI